MKYFNVIQFYEDILYEKKPTIKSFCGIEKVIENLLIFIYLFSFSFRKFKFYVNFDCFYGR